MRKHDPQALVRFLDARSDYTRVGYPARWRKTINGVVVGETDQRMIRRWRKGDIRSITDSSVRALLHRFKINPKEFTERLPGDTDSRGPRRSQEPD